jgi:hypothetical protein
MRPLYPANWKEISRRIRFERAGGKCEVCQLPDGAIGFRDLNGQFVGRSPEDSEIGFMVFFDDNGREYRRPAVKIVLTVAHLDHNPANNNEANLKALCQRCHNRHDGPHRAANAARTRRSKRAAAIPFAYPATCAHCTVNLGKISGPGFFGQAVLCGACFASSLEGQRPILPPTTEAAT